eukprot:m.67737 g.67737  ORF g.67737 m.67737 type:complete len:318 (+) comp11912_c0_seq2:299-1252(+)
MDGDVSADVNWAVVKIAIEIARLKTEDIEKYCLLSHVYEDKRIQDLGCSTTQVEATIRSSRQLEVSEDGLSFRKKQDKHISEAGKYLTPRHTPVLMRDEFTIYVGNLNPKVTEELLYELFLQIGPVRDVSIAFNKDGSSKGFGFVKYEDLESVSIAISLMDQVMLWNQAIRVALGNNDAKGSHQRPQSHGHTSPHTFSTRSYTRRSQSSIPENTNLGRSTPAAPLYSPSSYHLYGQPQPYYQQTYSSPYQQDHHRQQQALQQQQYYSQYYQNYSSYPHNDPYSSSRGTTPLYGNSPGTPSMQQLRDRNNFGSSPSTF